jgi:Ca-activated chloride channel family protein
VENREHFSPRSKRALRMELRQKGIADADVQEAVSGVDEERSAYEAAAKRASERGVKVFTVGIGTSEGELIPAEGGTFLKDRKGNVVKSRLDEKTLQDVATATGGVYVHGERPEVALGELYRDYIGSMEKRELGSTLERRWEQRFQWPLGVAVVLLVAEMLLSDRRPRRRQEERA